MSEEKDLEIKRILWKKFLSLMRESKEKTTEVKEVIYIHSIKEFKELLERASKEGKLLIADFWAPWCGPCLALAPIFEKVARNFKDKVYFAKINVDEVPELASEYGIMSIPTLMAFLDRELIDLRIGFMPMRNLITWIKSLLSKTNEEA